MAQKKGITIIGPATVGGIKPGAFKIGNTGGMMDNIVASKLYRPGSVSYVSKSGGMSNELNNIIANTTDGVLEGIAIGGDRYPGTTFIDHILRYQADPECRIMLLLGEVGGVEEYRVIEAVKSGRVTKPIVAWAIGTVAGMLKTEVQFGHAGSFANSQLETAAMKNESMRKAGIHVPDTFEELPALLAKVYQTLIKDGTVKPKGRAGGAQDPHGLLVGAGAGPDPQARRLHLHHLRRPRPGALVRRHAHFRRVQGQHRHRRRHVAPLVPPASARLRQPLPRDGAHAHGRPRARPCRVP